VRPLSQINFALAVHLRLEIHHRVELVDDGANVRLQEAQLSFFLTFNFPLQVRVASTKIVERSRVMILKQEPARRKVLAR
jgi:hypothetical protein